MKKEVIAICIFTLTFICCNKDENKDFPTGHWEIKGEYVNPDTVISPGINIFEIEENIFWGLGRMSKGFNSDFYMFDQTKGWVKTNKILPFPGEKREFATVITSKHKLYIGLGSTLSFSSKTGNLHQDIYEYDMEQKLWTKLPVDYPIPGLQYTSSFIENEFLYIGLGIQNYTRNRDFYRIRLDNPIKWELIERLPHDINGASTFSSNGENYIICGNSNSSTSCNFIKWDSQSEKWEEIPVFTEDVYLSLKRTYPLSIPIAWQGKEYIYIIGGFMQDSPCREILVYDTNGKNWFTSPNDFPTPISRVNATSCILEGKPHIITYDAYTTTLWEFIIE